MKTILSAVVGVAIALAAVGSWASFSGAATPPRVAVATAAGVSFLTTAPRPPATEGRLARAEFDKLTDFQVSPAAVVDASSIRKVGRASFLALRNDGSVCLSQRATLACYVGYEAGGISTSVGDGRTYDSPDAPFQTVIDGIARDGIKAVIFDLNDGSSVRADVVANTFAVTIPGHSANDLVGYRVEASGGTTRHTYAANHFPPPNAPLTIINGE